MAARRRGRCGRGCAAITSGSSIARRRCSPTRRDRSGAPRRPCWNSIGRATWSRRGVARGRLRMARSRARHLRRPRARLARRRRRKGRADSEVHPRRQLPDADRAQGTGPRAATTRQNLGGAASMTVDRDRQRTVRRRRLRQSSRHRVRRSQTGAYKRHWGAYGKRPDDALFHQRRREAAEPVQRRGAAREPPEPIRSGRSAAAAVPHRPRRPHLARRTRLRLRSHQRSAAGLSQGRHLRQGSVRREADAGQRIGVGSRASRSIRRRRT